MNDVAVHKGFAQTLEEAEARHLALQVEMLAALEPSLAAEVLPVKGGAGAITIAAFGRKLNHIVGLGMNGPVDDEDLHRLEIAFHSRGIPVEIDLCPLADPSAIGTLGRRGYVASAFSNTYYYKLNGIDSSAGFTDMRIRRTRPSENEAFIQASVEGFSAQPNSRPIALLEALARTAVMRPDTTLFLAEIDGQIAGTAAVAILRTANEIVAHLFLASTRSAFRSNGLQQGLLRIRLEEARQQGARLASVTARPMNTSSRNTERAGFHLAYTKTTFTKAPN